MPNCNNIRSNKNISEEVSRNKIHTLSTTISQTWENPQESGEGKNFGSEKPGGNVIHKRIGRVTEDFKSFGAGVFFQAMEDIGMELRDLVLFYFL